VGNPTGKRGNAKETKHRIISGGRDEVTAMRGDAKAKETKHRIISGERDEVKPCGERDEGIADWQSGECEES